MGSASRDSGFSILKRLASPASQQPIAPCSDARKISDKMTKTGVAIADDAAIIGESGKRFTKEKL